MSYLQTVPKSENPYTEALIFSICFWSWARVSVQIQPKKEFTPFLVRNSQQGSETEKVFTVSRELVLNRCKSAGGLS